MFQGTAHNTCTPSPINGRYTTLSAKPNRTLSTAPNQEVDDGLIQEQQGMLQRILDKQSIIEKQQQGFEERLVRLEAQNSSSLSGSSSESSSGKRKQTVTRALSVSLILSLRWLSYAIVVYGFVCLPLCDIPINNKYPLITQNRVVSTLLILFILQTKVQKVHNALDDKFCPEER